MVAKLTDPEGWNTVGGDTRVPERCTESACRLQAR